MCNTSLTNQQTSEEKHEIEVRLKYGWTIYKIAKHLQRSYNTIKAEVERRTVYLYQGKVKMVKQIKEEKYIWKIAKAAVAKFAVLKL